MKKIIISTAILFSTFMYSQGTFMRTKQFIKTESLCKAQIWDNDSCKYVYSPLYGSCYDLYEKTDDNDSTILIIVDVANDTNNVFYKVIEELDYKYLHWTFKVKDLVSEEQCYIHIIRSEKRHMVRVDYDYLSILYTDDYWVSYATDEDY